MTTLEVYGLATRTAVHLGGSHADELAAAVRVAWSRCLAPLGDELPGEDVSARLDAPGEAPEDAARHGASAPGTVRGTDLASVLQTLTQRITQAKITAQTGRLLMFHAGSVADPATGAALAFIAPGGTGKTTLASTLGRRLGYVTDETVGLDPEGRVQPYPKPLSVRGGRSAGPKVETSPDELLLLKAPPSPTVARFLLLERADDLTGPTFEELTVYHAIAAMTPESSALSALPRPLHLLAGLLDGLGPVLRVRYAEAASLVDPLRELLGTEARTP